ncbi:DUF1634 domain-containing protein [Daejeonia sp. YH14]|uniref:DUF1634 domain-containing protein n=1 Tax=Daejeonia sp. YH14 TaxID=3439042 RepID=UPI003F4913A8
MRKKFNDIDLNRSVGNLLRLGVILSVAVSLVGFVRLFVEGYKMPVNFKALDMTTENIFTKFWKELLRGEGMAIIQLGILLLILTPVMRIIFALAGYLKEKDYTYVVISLIVLGIITISFLTGYA